MFDDCLTLDQVERRKRSLVTELHPDAGGSNERFLAMMQAYEQAVQRIQNPVVDERRATEQPTSEPQSNYTYNVPPQAFYQPTLQDKVDNVFMFIQQSAELVAKAAVVYTTVMDQIDAIKAEKRKKARKPRKKLPKND